MKKSAFLVIVFWLPFLISAQSFFETGINLRDLDGKMVSSREVLRYGKATLVIFWKSSNSRCCDNLENIYEVWSESLIELDVRMVVINIDCNGSWDQVKPIVNGNSWDFETFIDVNCDLKRSMCVGDEPCTMLFNRNNEMVCRFNAACTGSRELICKNLMEHLQEDVTALK